MNLTQLQDELKTAMLAREELKTSVLRMLKAEIMKIQTDGSGTEITEELIQNTLQKLVKQRKEEQEIALLMVYLPEQMSEDAIRAEVRATKEALGVTDKSGVGKLMGTLMGKLKGKADGTVIKRIVEEEL
jgi:uncharacterized protein